MNRDERPQTRYGVPNILAGGFALVGVVVLAVAGAALGGVYDAPFPAPIYLIVAAVNFLLAVILWRLT